MVPLISAVTRLLSSSQLDASTAGIPSARSYLQRRVWHQQTNTQQFRPFHVGVLRRHDKPPGRGSRWYDERSLGKRCLGASAVQSFGLTHQALAPYTRTHRRLCGRYGPRTSIHHRRTGRTVLRVRLLRVRPRTVRG